MTSKSGSKGQNLNIFKVVYLSHLSTDLNEFYIFVNGTERPFRLCRKSSAYRRRTSKLRSRSFSHKSGYLSYLMRYHDPVESRRKDTHLISLDRLTLTFGSRSNLHRKILHFGFSHFNSDFSRIFIGRCSHR